MLFYVQVLSGMDIHPEHTQLSRSLTACMTKRIRLYARVHKVHSIRRHGFLPGGRHGPSLSGFAWSFFFSAWATCVLHRLCWLQVAGSFCIMVWFLFAVVAFCYSRRSLGDSAGSERDEERRF